MEKKNKSLRRVVSSSVLLGFLAILLCAPNVRADVMVPGGSDPCDIDYDVGGFLEIFGTANLYQGAYAAFGIFAYPGQAAGDPGSVVNIYGCEPGNSLFVLEAGTSTFNGLPPVVTIYGQKFQMDQIAQTVTYDPPADEVINGTLDVLDDSNNVLFSLWIATDQPIHLRAPESEDEEGEPIEAELWLMPKAMHIYRSRPTVFATLQLPEGITKDDVDTDHPLKLYTNGNDHGIEARNQRMYQPCRREDSKVKIFTFFNMSRTLKNAGNEEMQIQVRGRLKSGQEFYGNDTIKVFNPHKRYWGRPISLSRKYRNH